MYRGPTSTEHLSGFARRAAIYGGRLLGPRPPAGACAAGAPLLMAKAGGKPAGRGISIFPALHPPLETTKKGELRFPLLGTSPKLFYR